VGGRLFAIVSLAAFLAAVAPAPAANQTVTARPSLRFDPATVSINQGDTVTWTNVGGCGGNCLHDVAFDDGSFRQPPIPADNAWTVSRTFGAPGTFRYYCSIHGHSGGIGMSGRVVVNAIAGGPPSDGGTQPGATAPPGVGPTEGSPPSSPTTPSPSAPTTSPPPATQRAKGRCRSRRKFRIRLRQPDGLRFRSARVSVNGKPARVVPRMVSGRMRQTAEVDLRGLPRGVYRTRIRAVTTSGKVLRGTRLYRTCAKRRTPSEPPPL
jgi:plastocyanin